MNFILSPGIQQFRRSSRVREVAEQPTEVHKTKARVCGNLGRGYSRAKEAN